MHIGMDIYVQTYTRKCIESSCILSIQNIGNIYIAYNSTHGEIYSIIWLLQPKAELYYPFPINLAHQTEFRIMVINRSEKFLRNKIQKINQKKKISENVVYYHRAPFGILFSDKSIGKL